MMREFVIVAAAAVVLSGPAWAANTPQQERMKTCNQQAAGKKGADRKAFMSACLKGETPVAAAPTTQQERMKACNQQAGDRKGAERKAFMSQCLKKPAG